jgi:predicted AlkP superfamily phosphohydrolase/phosphomutase
MKAFALTSFSEGYVRVNLRGREAHGVVEASEYDALCNEIGDILGELTDARSGARLAERIVRARRSPLDSDPRLPDADLIVVWTPTPTDTADSPRLGRIGPLPLHRAASHSTRGFALLHGPHIPARAALPEGRPVDIAPTILTLLGIATPAHMDGASLV